MNNYTRYCIDTFFYLHYLYLVGTYFTRDSILLNPTQAFFNGKISPKNEVIFIFFINDFESFQSLKVRKKNNAFVNISFRTLLMSYVNMCDANCTN